MEYFDIKLVTSYSCYEKVYPCFLGYPVEPEQPIEYDKIGVPQL